MTQILLKQTFAFYKCIGSMQEINKYYNSFLLLLVAFFDKYYNNINARNVCKYFGKCL